MTSEFKISTIKHEVETYLSHGQYKEAINVYKKFLANTRRLHPSLRKVVDESIEHIKCKAKAHNSSEDMSDDGVSLPKRDRDADATVNNRMVNARTFINAGSYDRALVEYYRLLKNEYLTSAVIKGITLCLVHLIGPQQITDVVDRLANDIFKHPRNRKAFKHSVANKIDKDQYPQHFLALTHHLRTVNEDAEKF